MDKYTTPKECKLCNRNKIHSIGQHISRCHKDITQEWYYNEFVRNSHVVPSCVICGKGTIFYVISRGYQKYCKDCNDSGKGRIETGKKNMELYNSIEGVTEEASIRLKNLHKVPEFYNSNVERQRILGRDKFIKMNAIKVNEIGYIERLSKFSWLDKCKKAKINLGHIYVVEKENYIKVGVAMKTETNKYINTRIKNSGGKIVFIYEGNVDIVANIEYEIKLKFKAKKEWINLSNLQEVISHINSFSLDVSNLDN